MDYNYIPLGVDCSPAAALNGMKMRKMSLPFDWVVSTPETTIKCINDDFAQFHRNLKLSNSRHRVIDSYGIEYPHDYPTKGAIIKDNSREENDDGYTENEIVDDYREYTESVLSKYTRRIVRLKGLFTDNKPIIVLMRSSYQSAYNMKKFIDEKYNTNVIIVLATKENPPHTDNKASYIICCDPECQSNWNDSKVWENAIIRGKQVHETNNNAPVNIHGNWKMF